MVGPSLCFSNVYTAGRGTVGTFHTGELNGGGLHMYAWVFSPLTQEADCICNYHLLVFF